MSTTQSKRACLYSLPDGGRCCECDTCQAFNHCRECGAINVVNTPHARGDDEDGYCESRNWAGLVRWGETVDERADRILELLRHSDSPLHTTTIKAATGMGHGMLGGALSRLAERGDARRLGKRWKATQ